MADRKTRISARVREAVRLMVEEGRNRADAAAIAGLQDNSLWKALRRPDVCTYRNELMRVVRESAASKSIARVDKLAESAASEHVRLGANELLLGIEGIAPVARSEIDHRHTVSVPGLTIITGGWAPHQLEQQPAAIDITPRQVNRIGNPMPHPLAIKREGGQ